MQMQVEAERWKRATVLESEGTWELAINVAEGQKQAQILASEAEKAEQINKAAGEASAVLVKARDKAEAIQLLAAALAQQQCHCLSLWQSSMSTFSKLVKHSNAVLLPANAGDVTNMVAQIVDGTSPVLQAPFKDDGEQPGNDFHQLPQHSWVHSIGTHGLVDV
ncbi:stomatin-like protein 2, mitochondrial isoform X2 [Larus michahellis]|uniref:stomatin-like protein 2, mitochondrial isoform X2 n=1 Tax=Larus michahellis TaxID=119627 RepID=UPI003D9B6620